MPFAVGLAALVLASPLGAAGLVSSGGVVPNTSTGATANLAGPPSIVQKLHVPGSPADDDPAAVAALASPASPDDDLLDALDVLAAAPDVAAATAARQRALDILEGNPVPDRVYSGIPLLNWNGPARVKSVPAGGTVVVNLVRFGERTISDTSLLRFDDPAQPFSITYRVAELGAIGGVFSPAPLVADGTTPVGGLASVVHPLGVPNQLTGTNDTNKFHPTGAAEMTRAVVQEIVVKMPPANLLTAILDPDVAPGHHALATLAPATAERLAALQAEYGFSSLTPSAEEKAAAISRLSPTAPAKLLWTAVAQLDPADPGFLDAAHAAGTQNTALVDGMVTRTALPSGVPASPAAALHVALLAGEAYVSHPTITGRAATTIAVTNGDAFARTFAVRTLRDRRAVHGALDWGQFAWSTASSVTLAPGETRTVTVNTGGTTFALWAGDPDGGDQAGMAVAVENGPATTSLEFSNPAAFPSHFAQDTTGHLWIALAGIDSIARLTPGTDLASAAVEEFRVPGGNFTGDPAVHPLAPHDIAFDSRGIAWITLAVGNAIARFDPALGQPGTTAGFTIFSLPPCNVPLPACAPPLPPEPPGAPLRMPNQLKVLSAPNGDTIIWFTESGADAIGALRVAPDGTLVAQADLPCGCNEPMGIALDPGGAVWFSSLVGNEVVRMTPSLAKPFDAKAAVFDRFPIPSSITVVDAAHPTPGIETAGAHSLAIDPAGRVWVTEEETAKVGFLDPATAKPGSTAGFVEFQLGTSDFGAPVAPADLTIDAAGTVFWVDEYGDVVGSVTPTGVVNKWRPVDRASLTDAPFVDAQGNFWFVEAASNRLTRIANVAQDTPMTGPPPTITADLQHASVTGAGVLDTATVDIDVTLNGTSLLHASAVPVANGMFSVAAPGITSGAVVRVVRHGPHALPVLSFTVATLNVVTNALGDLAGTASVNGQPVGEPLTVSAGSMTTSVTPATGGAFATTVPAGSAGNVAWAGSSVAGIFRTVTAFAAPATDSPAVLPTNPVPAGDQPNPAAAVAPLDPPAFPAAPTAEARACDEKLWLTEGTVPVLGMSAARVSECFGNPTRIKRARPGSLWIYGRSFELRIQDGVVVGITMRDGAFHATPGGVGVGWPTWRLSSALPKLRFDRKTRTFRAVTLLRDGQYADIRIFENRRGRIAKIVIARQTLRGLDRMARSVL